MTGNSTTWLLVADGSKARIYSLHKLKVFKEQDPKELELIAEYSHAESRKKISELVSDKSGGYKSGSFGYGTYGSLESPKQHEIETFMLELLNHLEKGRKNNSFRELIIVAPPNVLGILNKHMNSEMIKLISATIEKNYTQLNQQELLKNLLNHL